MRKNERQDEILAILKKNKYAGVQDLSAALYASQPTIRRDLASLEAAGYVMRSHGGVILRDERIDTPVAFRSSTKAHQKMQISHAVTSLIGDSRTIFIDASTTASYLAGEIQSFEKLMVVTNSLRRGGGAGGRRARGVVCRRAASAHLAGFCRQSVHPQCFRFLRGHRLLLVLGSRRERRDSGLLPGGNRNSPNGSALRRKKGLSLQQFQIRSDLPFPRLCNYGGGLHHHRRTAPA